MSPKHLFGREDWYVIGVNHAKSRRLAWWRECKGILIGPKVEASIAWALWGSGFGGGFEFGINGSESDIGFDIYLGKLLSVWLRLRAPFTRWVRLDPKRHGYEARHFGVRAFPHRGCWLRIDCFAPDGTWSRSQPWWWEIKFGSTQFWGRTRHETETLDSGECVVPMPEGNYRAEWTKKLSTRHYVRFPGILRDRIAPRSNVRIDLDIPGCIPVEGKGENSWDCGMDGICGVSGRTLEDAIGNAVRSALRDRQRYGGPHDLPHPMTISQAENRS